VFQGNPKPKGSVLPYRIEERQFKLSLFIWATSSHLAGQRLSISFRISSAQRTASDIAQIVAGTRLSAS